MDSRRCLARLTVEPHRAAELLAVPRERNDALAEAYLDVVEVMVDEGAALDIGEIAKRAHEVPVMREMSLFAATRSAWWQRLWDEDFEAWQSE